MPTYGKDLFQGTAGYYAKYRLPYAKGLVPYLAEQFVLNTNSRVLDLGCGTGMLTLPLAIRVGEVVGVDPDQEMLDEAMRLAKEQQVTNIEWRHERAEDITSDLGLFSLVTLGSAFHWMDKEVVLNRIKKWLTPTGGLAIVSQTTPSFTKQSTVPWKQKRMEIIKYYLGEERRAGTGTTTFETQVPYRDTLGDNGFSRFIEWQKDRAHVWDLESLLGNLYSMSFARRGYFGDRLQEFEKEFRDELLAIEPSGRFPETITTHALLAWR